MKRIFTHILIYLKDWKNLLAHAIVGVMILSVALFLPVKPIYRVIILILVIAFNLVRMRMGKAEEDA